MKIRPSGDHPQRLKNEFNVSPKNNRCLLLSFWMLSPSDIFFGSVGFSWIFWRLGGEERFTLSGGSEGLSELESSAAFVWYSRNFNTWEQKKLSLSLRFCLVGWYTRQVRSELWETMNLPAGSQLTPWTKFKWSTNCCSCCPEIFQIAAELFVDPVMISLELGDQSKQ